MTPLVGLLAEDQRGISLGVVTSAARPESTCPTRFLPDRNTFRASCLFTKASTTPCSNSSSSTSSCAETDKLEYPKSCYIVIAAHDMYLKVAGQKTGAQSQQL